MNTDRIIFVAISILIIARAFFIKDTEAAAVVSMGVFIAGTMVWLTDFWTTYMLKWGFIESLARDSRKPGNSSLAVIFLGWVMLLLIGGGVFFL